MQFPTWSKRHIKLNFSSRIIVIIEIERDVFKVCLLENSVRNALIHWMTFLYSCRSSDLLRMLDPTNNRLPRYAQSRLVKGARSVYVRTSGLE